MEERRERDPDTGEITHGFPPAEQWGGGFADVFSKVAAKLTGKTASKLASKAAEKLIEKGAEKVGEKTGELVGEKIYDKFTNRGKTPSAAQPETPETKGEEIRDFLVKENSDSSPKENKYQHVKNVYNDLI